MATEDYEKKWIDYGKKHLLGKQIVSIRYLTEKEKENMMWYKKPIIIQLNDGTILFITIGPSARVLFINEPSIA